MKTTIHTIFAALLTGATLLSSCDDYLTTLPSDSLVSEGAITTEEDTKTAVNGLYEGLISVGDSYYYGTDFITRPEVGGEDIQTRMVGDRTENFYRFTDRQSNARESLWSVPYVVINRANVLLDAIESGSIPMTEVTKNSKGEALAIRALAHFNLLITYGTPYQKDNGVSLGVPVVTTVLDAASLPERLTVAQGYEAVLTDLTDALDFISEDKTYGHINLWGVKALIARVNLYKGNYEEAYKYAKDVIDHGGYNLVPNAEYISMWGQRENSESIFDLDLSSTMYGGGRELIGSLVAPSSYGTMIATTDFLNLLNEDPDDVRLGLLIKDKDGQKRVVNKYPELDGNIFVNNIRVIRLSDIYLIGAEAALRKGTPDQNSADEYLYQIRHRANPNNTKITATLDLVKKERRKELVMEGHRLYDILRVGDTVERKGGTHFLNGEDLITVNWNDYRTIMPIPQAEIDANPQIKQNPSY